MAIKSKDIKILWGRSGNRCAICQTLLTQDVAAVSAEFTLGEQAHIVGEREEAPRGKSTLTIEERNNYHNLILLCPNHHTEIDKNEADWPLERLYLTKSKHELWVTETLSEGVNHVRLANQLALSVIIDSAVECCNLEKWQEWTSFAMSPNQCWSKKRLDAIFEFRQKVLSAIWPPDYEEFKSSVITFSIFIHWAAQEFMKHCEEEGVYYVTDYFYKRLEYNPNYNKQVLEFENWQDRCDELLRNATKAANWFADIVRRDINPTFLVSQGKFLIQEGLSIDMTYRTSLLEFTDEEKDGYPENLTLMPQY